MTARASLYWFRDRNGGNITMSNERKVVAKTVDELITELKENPSTRFSKTDYQMLVYSILSDKDFKAKKYLLRHGAFVEEDLDISGGLYKFLDKLLKHAGVTDSDERENIIETFDYNPKDVEWISDAVDEAMHIYTECGKNMRLFRSKMLQLTITKMVRSGKYAGKVTYKKSVVDRAASLEKHFAESV